jgi:Tol biopolymer transport system component
MPDKFLSFIFRANMKYLITISLVLLLQGCDITDIPIGQKNKIKYDIIFISDRDSDGKIHFELGTEGEVYKMNTDGTNQTRITVNDTWDSSPKPSFDGSKIVYTSYKDWLISNVFIMNPDGSNVSDLGNGEHPTFSNDNSKIIYSTSGIIGIMNTDGSNKKILTTWADSIISTLGQDFPVQFSSDDQSILFISNRNNNYDIYSMNIDGTDARLLTNSDGYDGSCSYLPDNSRIVFTSYRNGNGQIYMMNQDGSDQVQLTTTSEFNITPSFSPNGKQIVFISYRDNQTEVYKMDIDGSNQKRLTNRNTSKSNPCFSPDGLKIAYEQRGNDVTDIMIIEIQNGEITNLTQGNGNNFNPCFRPIF